MAWGEAQRLPHCTHAFVAWSSGGVANESDIYVQSAMAVRMGRTSEASPISVVMCGERGSVWRPVLHTCVDEVGW